MHIATPIDYAETRRAAHALCSRLAFGDESPRDLAREAHSAISATKRHRLHLAARRLSHFA